MKDQGSTVKASGHGFKRENFGTEAGEPVWVSSGRQDVDALVEKSSGDALAGEPAA